MAKSRASWSKPEGVPELIGRKKVDWSIFEDGSTIPVEFHEDFAAANGGAVLHRGETHALILVLEGRSFRATLMNEDRTDTATDALSIRYDSNDKLKALLRDRLESSFRYLQEERRIKVTPGKKVYAKVPDSQAEYLDFYNTGEPFTYRVELLPFVSESARVFVESSSGNAIEDAVGRMTEDEFEKWLETVNGEGRIDLKPGLRKIRKLKRQVVEALKAQYRGKCQICGMSSIDEFGVDVSEGHHIDYFTSSFDNRPSNIAILCPTHHSLVHALRASLDRVGKAFVCNDDRRLPLVVNHHL